MQDKIGKKDPIRYEDLYEIQYQKELQEVVPDFIELEEHPKITFEEEIDTIAVDSTLIVEAENVTYVKETPVIAAVEAELKVVEREDDGLLYSENLKNQIINKRGEYIVHEVKKGETLFDISQKYDIPVKEIFKMNKLTSSIIPVGDTIKVKKI